MRLIDADELKAKVEAMVEHKVKRATMIIVVIKHSIMWQIF